MARCTPEALPSFDSGSSLQQLRSSWVPFDSSSFKSVTDGRTNEGLTWVGARDTCVSRKRVSFRKKNSNFFSTGFNVWISTFKVVTRELSAQPVCTLTSLHFARKHFLLHRKLSNQPAVTLTRTRHNNYPAKVPHSVLCLCHSSTNHDPLSSPKL